MRVDNLTRNGDHVHYVLLDDLGREIRQVDRDLTPTELRRLKVSKQALTTVVAETEGAEIVKSQPREQASSSVVVHAFEPHDHPEYLTHLPEHTHDEIKSTEDYLTRRLKDLETFVSNVQETLRSHGHELPAHEHPDKPLPVHEHPHVHDDYARSLESLQAHITRLSADVATALTEHDHTAILSRLMSVESEAKTLSGLLASHSHDHDHADFAAIRGEVDAKVGAVRAELTAIDSRLGSHGHPLPDHEHPHEHKDLKASIERVETKTLELEHQDAAILDRLSKVDATHRHVDVDEQITQLTTDVGAVRREVARHEHPHEHPKIDERIAKLDEKLAGHAHDDYAPKEHEHPPHTHDEFASLKALVEALDVKIGILGRKLSDHDHDGRYLKEVSPHEHLEYLTAVPEHEHKRYDERIDEHLVTVKASTHLKVLSREEVGGKVRWIVEEVS